MKRLNEKELFELFSESDATALVDKAASMTLRAACELKLYRDTGLEPSEIDHLRGLAEMVSGIAPDRLRELAEADKDGRCVVMPCKVGDTVWIHALVPCGACPHGADQAKICGQAGCPIHPIPASFSVRMFDGIGKTVFLTRVEAEAALKKGDEENA